MLFEGRFDGRTALVTGAAQGVGRAVTEVLAGCGAQVVAVDIDENVKELEGPGVGAVVADLGDPGALVSRLSDGPLVDVLVNNAATYPPGGVLASDDADWLRVFRVNVLAPAALSRAFAARLIAERRPGAIVNVGSVQQKLPLPGHAAYVASKGGLSGLTAALAVELGEFGIRVNEVSLGLIDSAALGRKLGADFWSETPPPTLLGRTGSLEEAAAVIAFLASDQAGYLTGAVLDVDGGRRLSRRADPQYYVKPHRPEGTAE